MDYCFDDSTGKYFPFYDVSSFIDYISMVSMCAPNGFIKSKWRKPEDQLNMDSAFAGLRLGMTCLVQPHYTEQRFNELNELIDQAESHFLAGNRKAGHDALEKVARRLQGLAAKLGQ